MHFDPLVAAARNRPTAVAITGEPGGGKTTLALLLILQLALRGTTVAVIDPKGDAESLVALLQGHGRPARVLPLGSAAPGLLDPFSFGDDLAERRTMATETLRLLLPRMSEERESAMIQAVSAVAAGEQPSLGKVVAHLEAVAGPGVGQPRRRAALHVGDAAGPAVLLAVRRPGHRRGRAGRPSSPWPA